MIDKLKYLKGLALSMSDGNTTNAATTTKARGQTRGHRDGTKLRGVANRLSPLYAEDQQGQNVLTNKLKNLKIKVRR